MTRDGILRAGKALLAYVPVQPERRQYLKSVINWVLGDEHMWVGHRKEVLWISYSQTGYYRALPVSLLQSNQVLHYSTGPTRVSAPSSAQSVVKASLDPLPSHATSVSMQPRNPIAARLVGRASHSSALTKAMSAHIQVRSPSCAHGVAACSLIRRASAVTSVHTRV